MKGIYTLYNGVRQIVGFAYTIDGEPGEPVLLSRLWVLPEYRGNGHGRALLKWVTIDADREYRNLLLAVDPDQDMDFDRLVKLYSEYGFTMLEDGISMKRNWKFLPKVGFPEQRNNRSSSMNQSGPVFGVRKGA